MRFQLRKGRIDGLSVLALRKQERFDVIMGSTPGLNGWEGAGFSLTLKPNLKSSTLEVEGRLVVVENVPARVCQETGEQLFAPDTVEHVYQLVWGQAPPKRKEPSGRTRFFISMANSITLIFRPAPSTELIKFSICTGLPVT